MYDYFYGEGATNKHNSPVKRLVDQKNSTTDHKKKMKKNINRQDYSLTYCPNPTKSYVV